MKQHSTHRTFGTKAPTAFFLTLLTILLTAAPACAQSPPGRTVSDSEVLFDSYHVLSRMGMGPRPGETETVAAAGPTEWVRKTITSSFAANPPYDPFLSIAERARPLLRTTSSELISKPGLSRKVSAEGREFSVVAAVHAKNQLRERMVSFWMEFLSPDSSDETGSALAVALEHEIVRKHWNGHFQSVISKAVRHPALLRSARTPEQKAALVARLTVGEGRLSPSDMQTIAKAFSGWRVAKQGEESLRGFVFSPSEQAQGARTFMGMPLPTDSGQMAGEAILQMLFYHPLFYERMALAVAVHFISPEPPPSAVYDLSRSVAEGRGDMETVMSRLAELSDFWTPASRGSITRPPTEQAVAAIRASDGPADMPVDLAGVSSPGTLSSFLSSFCSPAGARLSISGGPVSANPGNLKITLNHVARARSIPIGANPCPIFESGILSRR